MGVCRTIILIDEETAAQGAIPVVVREITAVPKKVGGGVHVAFNVLAFGLKVPPAGVDHVPPVAELVTAPDNVAEPP